MPTLTPPCCSTDYALILGDQLLVIDVESRPLHRDDPVNAAVARARDQILLNTITAAAVLVIDRRATEAVSLLSFVGFETEILEALDALLSAHPESALLTFNGKRFDLPLLQVRALHRGLFHLNGIGSIAKRPHVDLMRIIDCRTSLEALAASLNLIDVSTLRGLEPEEKCRMDVLYTFVAAMHLAAFEKREASKLTEALELFEMLSIHD